MRPLSIVVALSVPATVSAHDADRGFHPPGRDIDWGEAGVGSLRACAQAVFTGCCGKWQQDVPVDRWLGCSDKECLCRRDLISDVHKYIKKLVSVWCGGKEVDVDAALKLYNDYCSANGFPIPGYTYISTKTVRATTATPTSSKESTRNVTATTPSAATTNSPSGARGGSPPTATTVGAATASTTAHPSSSSRVHPPPWLPLLALVSVIPFILGTARAQTLVVTLTESDLPSAFTSVVTTRQTVISEPIVSNRKLNGTESSETTRTESSLGISTASTTNDSRTDAGRADNVNATGVNGDLSQLEIAGIAIGIILGIITAIATVWMCIRARR